MGSGVGSGVAAGSLLGGALALGSVGSVATAATGANSEAINRKIWTATAARWISTRDRMGDGFIETAPPKE